jgi:hypothetical protein
MGIGAALLLLAVASAGCGGSASEVAAAPEACLEDWNTDSVATNFGRHVYDTHESARAQVAVMKPVASTANIDAAGACAVIFAIPESDGEYGDVGLVVTDFGWAQMRELARDDEAELDEIQEAASGAANATLFPDGTLEPN